MLTTTAISYTNGKPHVGHLYELILADFLARKDGRPLLSGTDEHGKKIESVAKLCGESPYDFCTRHSALFKSLVVTTQANVSRFIRTTDSDHIEFVQACILRAHAKGDIYLSSYEGWYSTREETYVSESDAAESDFKDPVSGIPYEKISEPAYFFRLSKYQSDILAALKHIDIQPASALSSIEERIHNLKDICISRSSFRWGIPFPIGDGHCVYVWFDALLNYITGARSLGYTGPIRHVIGKDIVWFHTAIYLGILLSCDLLTEYIPTQILVHGFVTDERGVKMSKSLGNVVDVDTLFAEFPIEAIRFYFLFRDNTTGGGIHFSREDLVAYYNNILVKQFGNLFQRIIAVSIPVEVELNTWLSDASTCPYIPICEGTNTADYFTTIQRLLADANSALQTAKPWEKEGSDRVAILGPQIQNLLMIMKLLEPVIPTKIQELYGYLGWDRKSLHLMREKKRAFILL